MKTEMGTDVSWIHATSVETPTSEGINHCFNYCLVPKNNFTLQIQVSRGSSVNIVSDYGLDGVRSLTEAEDFTSNLCVQTGSGAHPASYTMATGGSFPGGKARPDREAHHSPPYSAEVKKEQKLQLL
jgi:hypothetical protein